MTIINIIAMVANVVGVYLAVRNNRLTWVFNLVASAALAAMFLVDGLYMSFSFNAYCAVMSVVGVLTWKKRCSDNDHAVVLGRSLLPHIAALVLFLLIVVFNRELSNHPIVDSLCTAMSIVATYLLVRKDAWTWVYWVASDIIYITLGLETSDWKYYCVYGTVMLLDIYGACRYTQLLKENNVGQAQRQ